ncbi:hypothetical protein AKJ16_DCAP19422 [Drosera capensis]
MMQSIGASSKCSIFVGSHSFYDVIPCKLIYVDAFGNDVNHFSHVRPSCVEGFPKGSLSLHGRTQPRGLSKWHEIAFKRWLCNSRDGVSSDDEYEYRSSRNIAISLIKRYRNVIERGGGDPLKEFIAAGVNAYALGCTDEGLRKELTDMKESGVEIEALESHGGNTRLRSKIVSKEVDECILWLSIVFITILCTPQPTIVRWSLATPVSEDMLLQWNGFCSIIANAYFMRGMAWLPVKTLQLEQMAVTGHAEEPSVVASRMRLVFSTLEVVSPQWPLV